MKTWLVSKLFSLFGGVTTIIEYALEWFNTKVLAKITDAEEYTAYCTDVIEFGVYLDGVFNRHQKWMSEAKREASAATINAIKELASALQDRTLTKEEVDSIVDKVIACIEAWKKAK